MGDVGLQKITVEGELKFAAEMRLPGGAHENSSEPCSFVPWGLVPRESDRFCDEEKVR